MVTISSPRAIGTHRKPRLVRRCFEVRTPRKKPTDGDEMGDDAARIVGDDRDAQEDEIAGHGVGEDMAVVQVDDGVEQAAGGGEEHGAGRARRVRRRPW